MSDDRRRRSTHRIFGRHAASAVIARRPEAIVAAVLLDGDRASGLDRFESSLKEFRVPVTRARRGELDRLVDGARHQGIVLEVESRGEFTLNRFERLVLEREARLRLLVLDGVEDPRNLGACLRTADAAAIDAVIVPKSRSCKLTAVVAKAATGAAETMPVLYAPNLVRALNWLKQAGVWIVGADAAAEASIFEAALTTPVAMVLGGEGRGLRRLTLDTCDQLVSIPMFGTVESLNVSVATGVALFELLRQCPSVAASPGA